MWALLHYTVASPSLSGGRLDKKAASDWFSRPCAKQKGWASSVRVFIDRVDLYASEGETRCSAVWSAHLFWVQRAIGSNPVTLMWWAEVHSPAAYERKKRTFRVRMKIVLSSFSYSNFLVAAAFWGRFLGSEGIAIMTTGINIVFFFLLYKEKGQYWSEMNPR